MQVAVWRDRALNLTRELDATTAQAHVWRRQLLRAGLTPEELDPHAGPIMPAGMVEHDRGMDEFFPDFEGPGDAARARAGTVRVVEE